MYQPSDGMNPAILLELAARWERDAKEPQVEDGSPAANGPNAVNKGKREAKRECADTLRMIIKLLC